ncbi:MAG: WG repeat-containing protein [Kofleriaceae bacterium]|nr:WG repeat-containing protein [Kofleriaceae bacterium]
MDFRIPTLFLVAALAACASHASRPQDPAKRSLAAPQNSAKEKELPVPKESSTAILHVAQQTSPNGTELYGYKNQAGSFAISAVYEFALEFSDGLAFAKDSEGFVCIDNGGKEVFRVSSDLQLESGFAGGWAMVKRADRTFSYLDKQGKLLPLKLERARAYSEGLAAVRVNGRWGFLGAKGSLQIQAVFPEVFDFHEGLAAAVQDDHMGFIDASGAWVIPPEFELVGNFGSGLAPAQPGDEDGWGSTKMGYIDHTGRFSIPASFGHAHAFSENKARVLSANSNDHWIYIDTEGKQVGSVSFSECEDFSNGMAAVQIAGKWGYIDDSGVLTIAALYSRAGSFSSGTALVIRAERDGNGNQREGRIDKMGHWIESRDRNPQDDILPTPASPTMP